MLLLVTYLVAIGICSHANALSSVVMDCPANQILVENVETMEMTTCSRYRSSQIEDVVTELPWFIITARAELPFACRCPRDKPFISRDGYTCMNPTECDLEPIGEYRHCPANQEEGATAVGYHVTTCYSLGEVYGDVAYVAECGCESGVIWVDGQTCVPRSECPPMCHGEQVLNLVNGSDCTPTCSNPDPVCSNQPVSRCECPADRPLLAADGVTCITYEDCANEPVYVGPEVEPLTYRNGSFVEIDCPPTQFPVSLSTVTWSEDSVDMCRETCQPNWFLMFAGCFGEPIIGCGCVDGTVMNDNRQCVRPEACEQPCFGSNQEWNTCGSPCIKTCANTAIECDDLCVPRCQCPDDRPFLLDQTTCVTLEHCILQQACEGDLVFTECGSACETTCDNLLPIPCPAVCIPGCFCPPATPVNLGNGHCGVVADCYDCEGDLEYISCASCRRTCDEVIHGVRCLEEMCELGCGCPSDTPVSLGGNRCGSIQDCALCEGDLEPTTCAGCPTTCRDVINDVICLEEMCGPGCQCPPDRPIKLNDSHCGILPDCFFCAELNLNYANLDSYDMRITGVDDTDLNPEYALQGHPARRLRAAMARSSKAKLLIRLRNEAADTSITASTLCVRTKNVKKIKLQYESNNGGGSWSTRVRQSLTCLGEETQGVTRIKLTLTKKSSKNEIIVKNMGMEACYYPFIED